MTESVSKLSRKVTLVTDVFSDVGLSVAPLMGPYVYWRWPRITQKSSTRSSFSVRSNIDKALERGAGDGQYSAISRQC